MGMDSNMVTKKVKNHLLNKVCVHWRYPNMYEGNNTIDSRRNCPMSIVVFHFFLRAFQWMNWQLIINCRSVARLIILLRISTSDQLLYIGNDLGYNSIKCISAVNSVTFLHAVVSCHRSNHQHQQFLAIPHGFSRFGPIICVPYA